MKRLACAEMEDFLGIRRGEVRIGGSTIPGEYILPRVMGPFGQKHPLVVLTLVIADSSEIESKVLQGDLELGVIGRKTSQRSLATNPLWQDELVIAVPPGHRWAKREEVSLKELIDEPFILRESGSGTLKTLDDYLRAAGARGYRLAQDYRPPGDVYGCQRRDQSRVGCFHPFLACHEYGI